jgi:hypothetical protein
MDAMFSEIMTVRAVPILSDLLSSMMPKLLGGNLSFSSSLASLSGLVLLISSLPLCSHGQWLHDPFQEVGSIVATVDCMLVPV